MIKHAGAPTSYYFTVLGFNIKHEIGKPENI